MLLVHLGANGDRSGGPVQKAFHFWRSTSNTAISAMAYSLCGGYGADDLWQIDDGIRDKERSKDFGEGFIRLARSAS